MEKTKLKTLNIKGREYTTVDSRVQFFREKFPTWSLETDYPVLDLDKGVCVCRAIVKDETGKQVADGYAHEWQSKPGSMVNKTSYIENAQTSAVGRALGFIGIGINGVGIATAEEVKTAIEHQENDDYAPVEDEIPFSEPTPAPKRTTPDDWLTVNAFSGIAARTNDISELQRILNDQRSNPHLKELAEIATARKREIMDEMQLSGGAL